jgi:hypothetical protein
MLCAIIGIIVVIASDASPTYSVAVRMFKTTGTYRVLMAIDCWLSFCWTRFHHISRQHSCLQSGGCKGGCSCRFHPSVHDRCTFKSLHGSFTPANGFMHRLSGCSISVQLLQHLTAATSIHLLFTKTSEHPSGTRDQCPTTRLLNQRPPWQAVNHRRCTLPPSLMVSRPLLL